MSQHKLLTIQPFHLPLLTLLVELIRAHVVHMAEYVLITASEESGGARAAWLLLGQISQYGGWPCGGPCCIQPSPVPDRGSTTLSPLSRGHIVGERSSSLEDTVPPLVLSSSVHSIIHSLFSRRHMCPPPPQLAPFYSQSRPRYFLKDALSLSVYSVEAAIPPSVSFLQDMILPPVYSLEDTLTLE